MSKEAMKLALDEFKNQRAGLEEVGITDHSLDELIKALEEALAKQEQGEPVAVVDANDDGYWADILPDRSVKVGQLLYTTPQQRKPLELSQMVLLTYDIDEDKPATQQELYNLIRKVEAAHGIKELNT